MTALDDLAPNGGTELIGLRRGAVVRVDPVADTVAVEVPAIDFEEALTLRGISRVVEMPAVPGLELSRGWLYADGVRHLDDLVEAAVAIATWWRAPLVELMEGLGLVPDADRSRFAGTVRGRSVEVAEVSSTHGRRFVAVVVPHGCEVPAGVRITAPGPDRPPTTLVDVVLDERVSISGPLADPDGWLARDDVRGALLEALLTHRGEVDATHVRGQARSMRYAPPVLRLLLDLAGALDGAP